MSDNRRHSWDYWFTQTPDDADPYPTHVYKCSQMCDTMTTRVQWFSMDDCRHDTGWVPDPFTDGVWMMCMRCLLACPEEDLRRLAEEYIRELFDADCNSRREDDGTPLGEDTDTTRLEGEGDSRGQSHEQPQRAPSVHGDQRRPRAGAQAAARSGEGALAGAEDR